MRTFDALCPKCQRSRPSLQSREVDKETGKAWLITVCTKCHFNIEIEEAPYVAPPPAPAPDAPKTDIVVTKHKRKPWDKYNGFY